VLQVSYQNVANGKLIADSYRGELGVSGRTLWVSAFRKVACNQRTVPAAYVHVNMYSVMITSGLRHLNTWHKHGTCENKKKK
jgi:hypothetical protein